MRHKFGSVASLFHALGKNKKGAAALVFALCLIPILLATGGAIDFTRYYDAQQTIQTALDASVLAGASADNDDTVATKTFNSWNVAIDGSLGTPGYSADTTSTASDYTGTVTSQLKMYFLPLIGIRTLNFVTTSKAERTISDTDSNLCLLLLDTDATPGMNVDGGEVDGPECEIDVDSTSSDAVTFDSTVTAEKICVAGTSSVNDTPDNYYTSCSTQSDPYADSSSLPSITSTDCSGSTSVVNYNQNSGNTVTIGEDDDQHCGTINVDGGSAILYPGTYSTIDFNNSVNVTLEPGVYIIQNGTWKVDGGSFSGTGVTFYFPDASFIQFNGSVDATLSAPTSGDYSGILMYEADGLSESSWTYNVYGTLTGLVHLPSRDVTFDSTSGSVNLDGLWVLNTLTTGVDLNLSSDVTTSGTTYSEPHLIR